MKYLGLSALLFCTAVNAQPFGLEKPVVCDKTEKVFKVLNETFQEVLFWGGNNSRSKANYALMLNAETKTWSLIQFETDVACILGMGNDHVTNAE